MPEYTITLLIWIVPIIFFEIFFIKQKLLSPVKRRALLASVVFLATIGILLDLFFARFFFTFPESSMTLGIDIFEIPIEEFIFYITGFWFILYLYIFCDEWFLKRYNPPDEKYLKYRSKLHKKFIFIHVKSIYMVIIFLLLGILVKFLLNKEAPFLPGYYTFLLLVAYTPTILFYRLTKRYVNWRAFIFTLTLTTLISIIWEVTLAIPRGYWGYQANQMLGIYVPAWASSYSKLPIEAVTVWIFCTLVTLIYEYIKIVIFLPKYLKKKNVNAQNKS